MVALFCFADSLSISAISRTPIEQVSGMGEFSDYQNELKLKDKQ